MAPEDNSENRSIVARNSGGGGFQWHSGGFLNIYAGMAVSYNSNTGNYEDLAGNVVTYDEVYYKYLHPKSALDYFT